MVFFSSGIGGSSISLARFMLVDDLFVRLDHPERGVFLVPVVELRVAHGPVRGDRRLELPGVVERVGVEGRELVAALRVRIRRQELLVQLGAGRVQLLALVQLLGVLLVLLPLAPCRPARAAWTLVAAVSSASSASWRATASASGLSLLCWYQSLPLVYERPERLALLRGGDQVAVLLVGVDDAVLHARRVEVIRPLASAAPCRRRSRPRIWSGRSRCRRGAGTPRGRAAPSRGPCRTPSRAAGR